MVQVVERMIKNPDHIEVKYFYSTPAKEKLLKAVTTKFKINTEGSVLSVVSHMVRIVSALRPYVKQTKDLDEPSLIVRDVVKNAIEPDTLLFESLPEALGFDLSKASDSEIQKFAKILADSTNKLQKKFHKTIDELKDILLTSTGIDSKEKIVNAASIMLPSVSDQKMKVFLTTISSEILEKDEDWINYVALSLTDVPMFSWKDTDREMFDNNLVAMSRKFKRLAAIHFAKISDNFVKPSYQVTVTHADGNEHYNVVSLSPEQKKKIKNVADNVIKEMKKKRLEDKDMNALIALLSSRPY